MVIRCLLLNRKFFPPHNKSHVSRLTPSLLIKNSMLLVATHSLLVLLLYISIYHTIISSDYWHNGRLLFISGVSRSGHRRQGKLAAGGHLHTVFLISARIIACYVEYGEYVWYNIVACYKIDIVLLLYHDSQIVAC